MLSDLCFVGITTQLDVMSTYQMSLAYLELKIKATISDGLLRFG
jgi:hypothetical protein